MKDIKTEDGRFLSHQIVLDARLQDVDDEARLRELSARREVLGVLAGERVLEVGRDLCGKECKHDDQDELKYLVNSLKKPLERGGPYLLANVAPERRHLVGELLDLRDLSVVSEVVHDFHQALQEHGGVAVLPLLREALQRRHSAHEHVLQGAIL